MRHDAYDAGGLQREQTDINFRALEGRVDALGGDLYRFDAPCRVPRSHPRFTEHDWQPDIARFGGAVHAGVSHWRCTSCGRTKLTLHGAQP